MALPSKETLRLIQWLASRNEEQLLVLAKRRGLSASQVGSLTAAATQLLDDRGLTQTLDALSRDALDALASLATGAKPEGLAELSELGLVDERENPALALISPAQLASLASHQGKDKPPSSTGFPSWTEEALGKQATVVASVLCELGDVIDALARHPQPSTRQGLVSVTGLKALAEILGEGYDIPALVDIGVAAGLLHMSATHVSASASALSWRESTSEEQWSHIAQAWWAALPSWLHRVVKGNPEAHWDKDLPALTSFLYPRLHAEEILDPARARASMLGIVASGCPTPWGQALFANQALGLGHYLPSVVPGVYATEDFTLLAPGPLSLEHRLILDRIAHRELGGLVPRYRLTSRSVLRALHGGIAAEEIVPLLQSASQTPLPSGMVHLITDTCRLAGDIELSSTRNGTTITLTRSELRQELLADPSLGPLSLRELDDRTLVTRLPVERVHDILLGARHMAMIAGEDAIYQPAEERVALGTSGPDLLEDAVRTLAASIAKAASQGVPPWLGSVLEVAIAAKVALEIEVDMPGGASVSLIMEPRSLAGGRLRGVELKNSMEKTVPISAIRSATPWSSPAEQ
jgi:hypothetical protein